jgi:HD-like signal output (HDOD) protein
MERLFDSSKALPSIPRVMQEIFATLNKEDFEVDEITRPLQQDPAMSAKVLRMANSAHYCQQRAVSSVDDAVVVVGLDAIRTMVIASGLVGSFSIIEPVKSS